MSIERGYVPNHKFWDDMGRITPNVEWSESHRPHFEAIPAPWLPTIRYEKEIEYYIVVSSGKVIALANKDLVPAGLRKKWTVATDTTVVLSYSATDVTEGVTDLTTGVAVTAAQNYTEAQLTAALKARGLITPTQRAKDFISKPIGFAPYNYYKAAGSDYYNPANLIQHNVRPQALAAVVCDYTSIFPVLPAVATTETMASPGGTIEGAVDWSTERVRAWYNATALNALPDYSGLTNVVAYAFLNAPVAHITAQSVIASNNAGLVNLVGSVGAVSAAGDYFVDYDKGLLFLYSEGGTAIPSPWSVSSTVTYYHYAAAGTNVSTFACATGNLDYGDFLTYDADSNLIKATLDIGTGEGYDAAGATYTADPDYSAADDDDISLQLEQAVAGYLTGIVGQVIGTVNFPRGYLDRVRTAYEGQTAVNMQTPGTATGGRTDQLTYTNSAEKMVIVNLILR